MGAYWLHDAPGALSSAGLHVIRYPGWETRSRSSGGFDDIRAVFMHHTASSPRRTDPMELGRSLFVTNNVSPVGNIGIARDGTLVFGAAGAANTQGAGGPLTTSRGVIGKDAGNRYGIAIEADNNGVGEIWGGAQLDAYILTVAILCDLYDLDPLRDVFAHFEWTTRKIDPAGGLGQHPYARRGDGALRWDMQTVRRDVHVKMASMAANRSIHITDPVRILDTRTGNVHNGHAQGIVNGGTPLLVRPHGYTPADASGIIVNVTGVGNVPGFFTLWSGSNGKPPTASNVNVTGPGSIGNNLAFVPLSGGTFKVAADGLPGVNHVILDQVGWYW